MKKVTFTNQKGAMFGLDARIAMAIFGVISVMAGSYAALTTSSIRGSAFTKELKGVQEAVEGIHYDLKTDIYDALMVKNEENAFAALFDQTVIQPGALRGRWLGPYLDYQSTKHSNYGDMALYKRQEDRTTSCFPGVVCYLWVTYSEIPNNMIQKINNTFDGDREASPHVQGRIQWEETGTQTVTLWFNATRAATSRY